MIIAVDASPWGLGGVLYVNGVCVAWFSSALTAEDERRFGYKLGDHRGQQTWEALAALVALRAWAPWLSTVRYQLEVKSDSIVALTLLAKLKAKGSGTGMIAQEVALDICSGLYDPRVLTHTPGISNVLPDALSRMAQAKSLSGRAAQVPDELRSVRETSVPERNDDYYAVLVAARTWASSGLGGPAR